MYSFECTQIWQYMYIYIRNMWYYKIQQNQVVKTRVNKMKTSCNVVEYKYLLCLDMILTIVQGHLRPREMVKLYTSIN